jgi:sugar phosphate permease
LAKAAGSAAGFIDFLGYIGAGMAGLVTGALTDRIGWESAFRFWIISALLSSVIYGALWKYKAPP